MKKEEERLAAQQEEYILKVEKLNAQLNQEMTEEVIKRIAREKLNLRDPGDQAFASDRPN